MAELPPSQAQPEQTFAEQLRTQAAKAVRAIGRAAASGMLVVAGSVVTLATHEAVNPESAAAAYADNGDYPWSDADHVPHPPAQDDITWGYTDKPTCDAKSAAYNCGTYKEGDYHVYDQWSYYLRNCTSYVAWRLAVEFGANASGMENATKWNNYAPGKGWSVDQTPEVGDIAHWEGVDGDQYAHPGHIAFVVEIGSGTNAGKVRVEEYNQNFQGNYRGDRWVVANNYIDVNGANTPDFKLKVGPEGSDADGGSVTLARPAAIDFNGALNVFIRGGDGQIYNQYWNGTNWTGYSSIGGNMKSDPAVIVNGNALNAFAIGADGQVYTQHNAGSGWSGWSSMGATTMKGNPRVMQYGGELNVFTLGTDGHPYKNTWQPTGGWSGWTNMGNYMDSSPTAVQYGSELDVIMRGGDCAIYKNTWNGNSWSGFGSLGPCLAGNPDAIAYGSQLDIWANAPGSHIWKRTWNGSEWGAWTDMGGNFAGDPDVMQYNSDLEVFVRGTDNKMYTRYWSAAGQYWSSWASLGGNIAGEPTAVQYQSELSVFAAGTDGKTYKNTFQPSTGWGGFAVLPG